MKKRVWNTLGYYALIGVVAAWAQPTHKSGLWMIASTTRILQPGETPGNFVANGKSDDGQASPGGSPACLTPELIHKYGVILPPSLKTANSQMFLRLLRASKPISVARAVTTASDRWSLRGPTKTM